VATPASPVTIRAADQQSAVGGVAGSGATERQNAPPRSPTERAERAAMSAVPEAGTGAIGIQRARAESARSDVPNLFVEGRARGGAAAAQQESRAQEVSAEADPSEAPDLIVAGLAVLRVHWTEVVPGQTGLRVLQRLPAGDTLEIRFVRSGGAAADAANDPMASVLGAELEPGWSQVVLPHRDGWIVAHAPLTDAELRALLRGLGQGQR
jgi:hypothetical protein